MNCKILIPLKTKEYKHHTQEDNLLYHFEEKNIYIMDNHRLSLWCWINEIDKKDYNKYTFVQIDDHFDCGGFAEAEERINNLEKNGIDYYKNLDYFRFDKINDKNSDSRGYICKMFTFASYLIPTIYLKIFNENKLYFFTKSDIIDYTNGGINDECVMNGNAPEINHFQKNNKDDPDNSKEALKILEAVLAKDKDIILDIDLDYFFDFLEEEKEYIKDFFNLIKDNQKNIKLITIALTQWGKGEDVLKIFNDVFDLEIETPLKLVN